MGWEMWNGAPIHVNRMGLSREEFKAQFGSNDKSAAECLEALADMVRPYCKDAKAKAKAKAKRDGK